MSDAVAFVVPVPPSLNSCFVNAAGKGRVRSAEYKAWMDAAGFLLASQRPGRVDGPYQVIIRLPKEMRGDIDNRGKPLIDLMVKHKITPDDRHLHKLTIERTPGIASACVSVMTWEG
jgi:Holliday junction resolvase RusA-like endonuclease